MKYLDKDGLTYLWGKIKSKIPTKTSQLTNDSGFSTFTGSYNDLTDKPTIPAQLSAGSHINITNNTIKNTGVWSVTESDSNAANGTIQVLTGTSSGDITVNVGVKGLNNAAYKNVSTAIGSGGESLPTSTAVKNFVEGKGYITSYTETDPIFSASAASGITASDITNWNSKTSNTGTITKVQANGTDVASSGVANIPSATTARYGVTKLSSDIDSTSEILAATPKAVKDIHDIADSAANVASVASSASATAYDLASAAYDLAKREIATAHLTAVVTSLGAANIPLNSITSNTSRLTLQGNGIKIGSGITKILISGNVFAYNVSTTTNPYLWISINKNNDNDSNRMAISLSAQAQGFSSASISPRLIDVAEGDIIYLHKIVSQPTCNIRADANTWLTVEVID